MPPDDYLGGTQDMHADLDEWPPPVPRNTEEFNALWDRIARDEIPDPTPHGIGGDHCPYCFSDWKQPHAADCAYKPGAPAGC
jgi:hypothetical protein